MDKSYAFTFATREPLQVVRERLEESCRSRGWTVTFLDQRVTIAFPDTQRTRGMSARFIGRLVNDGETTRLVGNTQATIVPYFGFLSIVFAGMALAGGVAGISNGQPLLLLLIPPIPLALSALFGFVAWFSTSLPQKLCDGLQEIVEGGRAS